MKHLYRSYENRVVCGLLGGLGEYYDIDPVLLRLGFIFLVMITGLFPGVLAYFIGSAVVPLKPHVHSHKDHTHAS